MGRWPGFRQKGEPEWPPFFIVTKIYLENLLNFYAILLHLLNRMAVNYK